MVKTLSVLFLFSILFFQSGNIINAQGNPINITVSPISFRLNAEPGTSLQSEIKIRNNTNTTETFTLTVGPFTADEYTGNLKLLEQSGNEDYLNWISFSQSDVIIPSQQWVTIPVKIDVPADAALTYNLAVFITQSNVSEQPNGTSIRGASVVPILLNVESPDTRRELQLVSFRTSKFIVESLPQEFEVEIKNTGNTYLSPSGNIFIDGHQKENIGLLPINDKDNLILPNNTRIYKVIWDDGFPKKGSGFLGFDWNISEISKFRFGKYTTHVLMVYDNGNRDVASEAISSFWVIPWKLILIAIVILALILFGAWNAIKHPLSILKK